MTQVSEAQPTSSTDSKQASQNAKSTEFCLRFVGQNSRGLRVIKKIQSRDGTIARKR